MKIKIIFILIIISLSNINAVSQQTQKLFSPKSFGYISDIYPLTTDNDVEPITIAALNKDSLIAADEKYYNLNPNVPFKFGISYPVKINLKNNGTWDQLYNGDRIWRLRIICQEAYSINIIYNHFYLPNGAMFFLYNSEKSYVIGEFTNANNKHHGKFATDLIPGDTCFLELYEPKEVFGQSIIELGAIIYGYIDIVHWNDRIFTKNIIYDELQQSFWCNRNVNCPEGDAWCRQKYSISNIIVNGNGICSGCLLNNVRENYVPYFLTANHCVVNQDPDIWIFQFGYMYEHCNGGSTLAIKSYTGADIRANWANTDFALLELQEQPLSGETNFRDVYFSGWDRTGNTPTNVTALHHPAGDRMKISIDNDIPTTWTNYWLIRNWDVGTTEGGSSGCPLFNQNQRVIGQNRGQLPPHLDPIQPPCDPNKETIFGMLSISWEGGGTPQTRLRDWLDPDNTGVETLDGIKMPFLLYGLHVNNGQTLNRTAYDVMKIGSSQIAPFTVHPGGNLSLKAGREIVIRSCTKILEGSTFHAYIEEVSCSDTIYHSHKESRYNGNVCGTYPPKASVWQEGTKYVQNNSLTIRPNPFDAETKITVALTEPSEVRLEIFDFLGSRVALITSGEYYPAGSHNFTFLARNIKSGVYYVVMSSSTERITRPLLLIK